MKIKVNDIPEEGLNLPLSMNVRPEGLKPAGPVIGQLSVMKRDDEVYIAGNAKLTVMFACNLCLAEFLKTLDMHIDLTYVAEAYQASPSEQGEDEDTSEEALILENEDVCHYGGDEIDLDQLILEQIWLSVPMKQVCADDCKGLCPKCGANLNEGPCVCKRSEAAEQTPDSVEKEDRLHDAPVAAVNDTLMEAHDFASILKTKFKVKEKGANKNG